MVYIIVFGLGVFFGIKINKALFMLKTAKDVKVIEKVVERILSKDKIKIVETKKERDEEKQEKADYVEFMRFKKMQKECEQE